MFAPMTFVHRPQAAVTSTISVCAMTKAVVRSMTFAKTESVWASLFATIAMELQMDIHATREVCAA